MIRIAILLTVYNRKEKTIQCLRNIQNQDITPNIKYDIYIVDGGSTDNTVDTIKKLFPAIHIKVVEGLYWNRGMIEAWKMAVSHNSSHSVYNYYLWLNDDTFIYPKTISSLLEISKQKNDQAIITGCTVDTKTKSKLTYGGRDKTGHIPLPSKDDTPTSVVMINGNIVLIPDYVYKKNGMLDPYFTHARGDFDYGLRASKVGIEMWQVGHPLGECDLHERIDSWCDPTIPFKKRWSLMHKPNGMPPKEIFHLEYRHYGLFTAIKHYITVHIRCLLPNLWIRMGKAKLNINQE